MVDARLADGSRVNAIILLALSTAPCFHPAFRAKSFLVSDLIARKAMIPEMGEFLSACIRAGEHHHLGDRVGEDYAPERHVRLHPGRGAGGQYRGRGRSLAPAAARGPNGDPRPTSRGTGR